MEYIEVIQRYGIPSLNLLKFIAKMMHTLNSPPQAEWVQLLRSRQ